jgi:hypothetical protein
MAACIFQGPRGGVQVKREKDQSDRLFQRIHFSFYLSAKVESVDDEDVKNLRSKI